MNSSLRHVALVAYPGVQVLDVAGPHEVFAGANQLVEQPYELHVVSNGGGIVATESGLTLATDDLDSVGPGTDRPIDTLLVAGGRGVQVARTDDALLAWLAMATREARRVGSVCSGAFLLGELGLLDGRRVTTHWARADQLAEAFPDARVTADRIHVHDDVWTSAGVTAGIDLSLALVEHDHDVDVAQTVARWLVMFLRRPGGQSQFCAPVWERPTSHDGIRSVIDAVHLSPGESHTVTSMADRAAMSPRHFTRVFTDQVGVSPARFVERVRVDTARELLESTSLTAETIADRCGFGTGETMRRAFVRSIGTSPGAYRRHFSHHRPPIRKEPS